MTSWRVRVHSWGPWTLTHYPRHQPAPKNANFSINVHFLRHFQQHSPGLPVHASSPAVWRMHHSAHHHSQTAEVAGAGLWSLKSSSIRPTLLELVWFRAGRGMCPGFSSLWRSQVSLDPKRSKPTFQTQNPALAAEEKLHQPTQPLPALFSLGFWSVLQPTIFVAMLVKGPSHQAGDTHGTGPMGTGSSMGHCRKLTDGYRSLPRGSRLSAADRTKVATVGTCDEVGVLRRFFLADFRMTLLLTSSRVMAE